MNSRQRLLEAESDADMPYAEAPDLEARLECLKGRLLADEESLFAPAEVALRALNGSQRQKLMERAGFSQAAGTSLILHTRRATIVRREQPQSRAAPTIRSFSQKH